MEGAKSEFKLVFTGFGSKLVRKFKIRNNLTNNLEKVKAFQMIF
jgi:hypothetical protein